MPASANSLNSIPCEDRKGGTIRYCPVVADASASAAETKMFIEAAENIGCSADGGKSNKTEE